MAGGGGDENMSFFITSDRNHRSVTDEEQASIREWLSKEKRVEAFEIGEPKDAWQPCPEDPPVGSGCESHQPLPP